MQHRLAWHRHARRAMAVVLHVAFVAVVLWLTWNVHSRAARADATQAGHHRLDMYAASLQATLEQYSYLPFILSINDDISLLLASSGSPERVNRYLEQVNREARTAALFVIRPDGRAIASSNWRSPYSFVGQDYAFRPYFQQAIAGKQGSFYGVGNTSREPGFFLSWPVLHGEHVRGVVVVKINLSSLESTWSRGGERLMVADANGVVFLSSVPAWKFGTLSPLPEAVKARLAATRQYVGTELHPLRLREGDRQADGSSIVRIGTAGPSWVMQTRPLEQRGWTLILLSDWRALRGNLGYALFAALAGALAALLLFHLLRQRFKRMRESLAARRALQAANDALERKVALRTADLERSNARLLEEIDERVRAEASLQATRNALVEASKLAAVGQMAAGIAHELNQPLAALRTFAGNTRVMLARGQGEAATRNLEHIDKLVERMAVQTGDLKNFARRHQGPLGSADAAAAMDSALAMLDKPLRDAGVAVTVERPAEALRVGCDALGLEQIFGNLTANAVDAMANSPVRRLAIRLLALPGLVRVEVADTGPGIDPAARERVFEPFFTTKPRGRGLGLGLAIVDTIVRQSGGRIEVVLPPEGGTCFVLSWPRTES